MLTDNARHENVPPPFDLNRILKLFHKKMIELNYQKMGANYII